MENHQVSRLFRAAVIAVLLAWSGKSFAQSDCHFNPSDYVKKFGPAPSCNNFKGVYDLVKCNSESQALARESRVDWEDAYKKVGELVDMCVQKRKEQDSVEHANKSAQMAAASSIAGDLRGMLQGERYLSASAIHDRLDRVAVLIADIHKENWGVLDSTISGFVNNPSQSPDPVLTTQRWSFVANPLSESALRADHDQWAGYEATRRAQQEAVMSAARLAAEAETVRKREQADAIAAQQRAAAAAIQPASGEASDDDEDGSAAATLQMMRMMQRGMATTPSYRVSPSKAEPQSRSYTCGPAVGRGSINAERCHY